MTAPWPDGAAIERARQALPHLAERASEVHNAHRAPCVRCRSLLSDSWSRVGRGQYRCAACDVAIAHAGPDVDAMRALGLTAACAALGVADPRSLSDEEWSTVLIWAQMARRGATRPVPRREDADEDQA